MGCMVVHDDFRKLVFVKRIFRDSFLPVIKEFTLKAFYSTAQGQRLCRATLGNGCNMNYLP